MILNKLKLIATVSLDFYTNNIKTINVKQCDANSRFILVSFTEYGKKVALNKDTMSVITRYKKADGKFGLKDCEILEDGNVLIETNEQMLASAGRCRLDVVILESNGLKVENYCDVTSLEDINCAVLSSMPLDLNVVSSPINKDELESEYDFTALNSALFETKEAERDLLAKHAEWAVKESERQENETARQAEEIRRGQNVQNVIVLANQATDNANTASNMANDATKNADIARENAELETENCQNAIIDCEQATSKALEAKQACQNVIEGSGLIYMPHIYMGSGDSSTVIGVGDANGAYSIASGTNDKNLVKDMIGTLGALTNIDKPTAYGDMSLSFGAGTKALSEGTVAMGANTLAGCKGFYYWSIDFTYKVITLSTNQKPLGTREWTDVAKTQLGNLAVNDVISIVNNSKYVLCSKITAIDVNAGTITVDSLPFTEIKSQTLPSFDDYSIVCPAKPTIGIVNLGLGAFAIGLENKAVGSFSHVEGRNNTGAGDYSHVEGRNNIAGYTSHAEGRNTIASGEDSHAEGYKTEASGYQSHAEGWGCKATNKQAHAEGDCTTASGEQSHAEGESTKATNTNSHAEGYNTKAEGKHSHAEGNGTTASGESSHAEGNNTEAVGITSHAEGWKSKASGESSHAEGYNTEARGNQSHAEGYGCKSINKQAHAEGDSTTASGEESHAEGCLTIAKGTTSHAEGRNTIASGNNQHVQGKYNVDDVDENGTPLNTYAHIVGGGSSDTNRKNIHTLDWDGNAWYKSISLGGTHDKPVATIGIDEENGFIVFSFNSSEE